MTLKIDVNLPCEAFDPRIVVRLIDDAPYLKLIFSFAHLPREELLLPPYL